MSKMGDKQHLRRLVETSDPSYLGLKKLHIRGRNLTNLPIELFSIFELEVLLLSPDREACLYYNLSTLPKAIGQLVNLRVLALDTNDLHQLPVEICQLPHLHTLVLSNNQLKTLPQPLHMLKSLRSLHLANNSFHEFPRQICNLPCLEFLDFSDNRIACLPDEIGKLKMLTTLILFLNCLQELPETFCDLKELRCLWLGANKLSQLPKNFGRLTKLDWHQGFSSIVLDGNPLRHPPLNICRLGITVIRHYLESAE